MDARFIAASDEWGACLAGKPGSSFLQTWSWGELHRRRGHRVFRLAVYAGARAIAAAQLIKYHLLYGTFLYCPRGPLFDDGQLAAEAWSTFLEAAVALARREHAVYLRISPAEINSPEVAARFQRSGFIPAPTPMHVEHTWLLDLDADEERLWAGMRRQTRSAIRHAQAAGVTVAVSAAAADLEVLTRLYAETARRNGFRPLPADFIRQEGETFLAAGEAQLFLAHGAGRPLAAVLVLFHQDVAYAHHGASASEQRKLFAAHLLQWEIIRAARRRGCKTYDLWGVSPTEDPQHPWAGFSFFKRSFGGRQVDYVHAQDLPLTSGYWMVHLMETLRRRRRALPLW